MKIEDCSRRLFDEIRRWENEHATERIHLVAHSMGGIIVRTALLKWIPVKLGRIVMLGTPNAGSDAARRLAPRLGWLCPYLHELSDASDSYINTLPSPDGFEIGVIASPKDHVVPLESALAVPVSDHALVRIRHGLIPCSRRVAREVVVFLETGHFSASAQRRVAAQRH